MDKKSKEALRRYKKTRQQHAPSSESSSSSESDSNTSSSYSSSESERKAAERHRRKKLRQATGGSGRRSSSTSAERRKREKREHCAKKLEAKRNHIKRKLKEAKLKKRAAAAAAALSGHSHRALSPATQAKLKKLAERKHQRAISKERREHEREKHRSAIREHERDKHRNSRSPNKMTKIRIHQDVQRQKSPARVHHLMAREKIIIQTRTRSHTPSAERRQEQKMRHEEMLRERERRDRDHREREIARDKERAEALARCQERQRERERLAREKLRREEEEKKYGRLSEREFALAHVRGAFGSRERSMDPLERARHMSKRELEVYEREREYLEAERRGLLERDEFRRRELSPVNEHYAARLRDPRDLFLEEERERVYGRYYDEHERAAWLEARELREREMREYREFDRDLYYPEERILRERERLALRGDWKADWDLHRERDWHDAPARAGFAAGVKRGGLHGKSATVARAPTREREQQQQQQQREREQQQQQQQQQPQRETAATAREPAQRAPSEPDWDAEEEAETAKKTTNDNSSSNNNNNNKPREPWVEHDNREKAGTPNSQTNERRWPTTAGDWREAEATASPVRGHRNERGGRGFRRGSTHIGEHGERGNYRPPALMQLSVQAPGNSFHGNNNAGINSPRFPNKRMTYTNPNIIRNKNAAANAMKTAAQASAVAAATTAVAAAKAAAQSAANATTNPGILAQVSGVRSQNNDKPEAGEIVADADNTTTKTESDLNVENIASATAKSDEKAADLSEISDSEDDILSKETAAKKPKLDDELTAAADSANAEANVSEQLKSAAAKLELAQDETASTPATVLESKADDDEMLDFEEISDGELEEEARHKGVGDALGVDWASLIEETKRQSTPTSASEQMTTAKQRWQPHRLILNMGVSMRMAGEDYAKRLLQHAQQQLLNDEAAEKTNAVLLKSEIKEEVSSVTDENSQSTQLDTDENTNQEIVGKLPMDEQKCLVKLQLAENMADGNNAAGALNVDQLHPYACIQMAERKRQLDNAKLFSNICGTDSRALSARQDLQLRRQLCGLPARACDFPQPLPAVSNKLKALILERYQRTLQVK